MNALVLALLGAAGLVNAQDNNNQKHEPLLSDIKLAAASVEPLSPVSNVPGLAFDRFYQIWLENIDFKDAAADKNMKWLASQGITLTNYYGTTHPSQPNYVASVGGDNWGMDNDDFQTVPENISTVADLLDTKGIAWAEYQEHLPYPGFQGYNFSNQKTGADDYVRKHNPLVTYDSVAHNSTRLRQIKNFTSFEHDLSERKLPQWAFITPNMTNDGHDTNITFAAKWERNWMAPLLNNIYFMNNTLVLLTFDEDDTYTKNNRVFSILVGGAIPMELRGTKDDTFYTHYSTISSISANWGLPSLGRWDCGANIFNIVANKTGYVNYEVDITNLNLNETYPGPLSENMYSRFFPAWPTPMTSGNCSAGHGILEHVKNTWSGTPTYNYSSPFPIAEKSNYNVDVQASKPAPASTTTTTSTTTATHSSAAAGLSMAPSVPGALVTSLLGLFLGVY